MIEKLNPDSQVVAKINELIMHLNTVERLLLSEGEREALEETEDIKEADAALKRGKFISIDKVKRDLGIEG